MLATAILLNIFLIPHSFAASKISCEHIEIGWIPVNEKKIPLAHQRAGFQQKLDCESHVVDIQGKDYVCNWSGGSFRIYNSATGMGYGSENDAVHYPTKKQCFEDAEKQLPIPGNICNKEGNYYYLRHQHSNFLLSPTSFSSLQECQGWIPLPQKISLSCYSVGPGARLMNQTGYLVSPNFKSVDECNGALELIQKKNPKMFDTFLRDIPSIGSSVLPPAFVNSEPDAKIGFSLKSCESPEHNNHLTKSKNGYLVEPCAPDTLYSWGGVDKLKWFLKNLSERADWADKLFAKTLFLTSSAAATFGYGVIPLRFKIKPGVKFLFLVNPYASTCAEYVRNGYIQEPDLHNTVIARYVLGVRQFTLMEYMICSPQVISSWSYGTKEHFDEILRDHNWMTTHSYREWEGYTKNAGVDEYLNTQVDSESPLATTFSLGILAERMFFLKKFAEHEVGRVYAPSRSEAAEHFNTAKPTYFNPN